MTHHHGRRDSNHAETRDAFRRLGWVVVDLADVGNGCGDLLCARSGETIVVEVKQPGAAFTEAEVWFQGMWPDRYETVRCLADVSRLTERG
jgi:hypothetical protein